MQIREMQQDGAVALITLSGRVTINDQPGLLKDAVTGTLKRGARHILLDLSGVGYIDSTRLGELISAHVTVTKQNGHLRLVAVPDRVAELLHLAGLDQVFERYDTAEEAAKGLN
ncbi:MAG TPA: STAS domain-containing protein [Vicinamibacterales bacterium]|nr:STAS domain-containing protein [Vicinamibacterales bacterium]